MHKTKMPSTVTVYSTPLVRSEQWTMTSIPEISLSHIPLSGNQVILASTIGCWKGNVTLLPSEQESTSLSYFIAKDLHIKTVVSLHTELI